MEAIGRVVDSLPNSRDVVAKIEQKALQLSALLRELDNRPVPLDDELREELEAVLDQLGCRISATRALERRQPASFGAEAASAV